MFSIKRDQAETVTRPPTGLVEHEEGAVPTGTNEPGKLQAEVHELANQQRSGPK